MSITKNKSDVRINSGNNPQIKIGSTWHKVGNLMEGSYKENDSSVAVSFADGDKPEFPGSTTAKISIVLAQITAEMFAFINGMVKKQVEFYHHNGLGFNNKDQEFYFPEVIFYKAIDLGFGADKQQVIALEGSVWAQSSIATCTPDEDLPSDARAAGASPVNSDSRYYVVMDTVAS